MALARRGQTLAAPTALGRVSPSQRRISLHNAGKRGNPTGAPLHAKDALPSPDPGCARRLSAVAAAGLVRAAEAADRREAPPGRAEEAAGGRALDGDRALRDAHRGGGGRAERDAAPARARPGESR